MSFHGAESSRRTLKEKAECPAPPSVLRGSKFDVPPAAGTGSSVCSKIANRSAPRLRGLRTGWKAGVTLRSAHEWMPGAQTVWPCDPWRQPPARRSRAAGRRAGPSGSWGTSWKVWRFSAARRDFPARSRGLASRRKPAPARRGSHLGEAGARRPGASSRLLEKSRRSPRRARPRSGKSRPARV